MYTLLPHALYQRLDCFGGQSRQVSDVSTSIQRAGCGRRRLATTEGPGQPTADAQERDSSSFLMQLILKYYRNGDSLSHS